MNADNIQPIDPWDAMRAVKLTQRQVTDLFPDSTMPKLRSMHRSGRVLRELEHYPPSGSSSYVYWRVE